LPEELCTLLPKRGRPLAKEPKQAVCIRLSPDIVATFKSIGKEWRDVRECRSGNGRSRVDRVVGARKATGYAACRSLTCHRGIPVRASIGLGMAYSRMNQPDARSITEPGKKVSLEAGTIIKDDRFRNNLPLAHGCDDRAVGLLSLTNKNNEPSAV
jgi:hypothetical protein